MQPRCVVDPEGKQSEVPTSAGDGEEDSAADHDPSGIRLDYKHLEKDDVKKDGDSKNQHSFFSHQLTRANHMKPKLFIWLIRIATKSQKQLVLQQAQTTVL